MLGILGLLTSDLSGQSMTVFGLDGEFTAFLEGGVWHLRGGLNMGGGTTYRTRAQAFEAAADVARARGDSPEECGKLRAGVRW
jgi:hypothetical protein